MPKDVIAVVDDGNHTYLTAELFPILEGGRAILPTDFNAMGYAVPAATGAKLARPDKEVFAIVGDGAFTMTCMELLTATGQGLGFAVYVFHDGELSQIAQAQEIPYARKPCTTLGALNIEGVALAVGAQFLRLADNAAIEGTIAQARRLAAEGRVAVVDVAIDYSKRTAFTEGAVKTNFRRFPLAQKFRLAARAIGRRLTG
jgi:acetolactate synthase-1/2/3 large subunit